MALARSGRLEMRSWWRSCSQTEVVPCIRYAAAKYGQSPVDMLRVAWCESRYQPLVTNGTDDGLYEFAPGTFAATAYGRYSIWSARYNALAAGWAWAHGWGPADGVRAPYRWTGDQWECV